MLKRTQLTQGDCVTITPEVRFVLRNKRQTFFQSLDAVTSTQ